MTKQRPAFLRAGLIAATVVAVFAAAHVNAQALTALPAKAWQSLTHGVLASTPRTERHARRAGGSQSATVALHRLCDLIDSNVGSNELLGDVTRELDISSWPAGTRARTLAALRRFIGAGGGNLALRHCLAVPGKRLARHETVRLSAGAGGAAGSTGPVAVAARASASRGGFVLPLYARVHGSHSERLRVTVAGAARKGLALLERDPLSGRAVPVHVLHRGARNVVAEVKVASYPRVLVVRPRPTQAPRAGQPGKSTTPTGPAGMGRRPSAFSIRSPWTTPVPANAPLDPSSSSIVSNLLGQIQQSNNQVYLNTTAYSAPIFTVPDSQSTVNMTWNNCQGKSAMDPNFASALHGVPIPANAFPSNGSDGDMVIWQPSTNTEWEFWKAAKDPSTGVWSACWGGRIDNVTSNMGIFPSPYGVSASGLSMLAYLIRTSEVASGQINHAIAIEVPKPRANVFSWPANRTDGTDPNSTDPAEGERLRLNPKINLATLNLSPGELAIARAIQTYGLIVTDTAGSVALEAEDPRPYEVGGAPDPYGQYFNGGQYAWLKDIPWQDLQVLAWNYGEPGS